MTNNRNDSKPDMHFNILQFNHPKTSVDLRFIKEEKRGWQRFIYEHQNDYFKELIDQNFDFGADEEKVVYTDFSSQQSEEEDAKLIAVKLPECNAIAKAYYTTKIQCYLKEKVNFTDYNFLKDTTVWIYDQTIQKHKYKLFKKFTLRVQFDENTNQPEMLLSYDKLSKVFNYNLESLLTMNIDFGLLINLTYQGRIISYEYFKKKNYSRHDLAYPVINNDLQKALEIPFEGNKFGHNKYKQYYEEVSSFYDEFLNQDEFKENVLGDLKWKPIDDELMDQTTSGADNLVFNNAHINKNPYFGLKLGKGVYQLPENKSSIRILYILHKSLSEKVHWLDNHLRTNRKNQQFENETALDKLFRLPVFLDHDAHITYEDKENPLKQIEEKFNNINFHKDYQYFAFFITDIDKDSCDNKELEVYYKIKEFLLYRNIASQVILKSTIENKFLSNCVRNIGVATIAKLGGIPWRLKEYNSKELIVGIGAFRTNYAFGKVKYIGSAFAFQPDGKFSEFSSFPENEMFHLAASIQRAIREYKEKNGQVERLIVHLYKTVGKKELKPIYDALANLGFDKIPVVVLTINKTESRDIMYFDPNHAQTIPESGTFVRIANKKYLLSNNTRYNGRLIKSYEGFTYPVKIQLWSSNPEIVEDDEEIQKLIDQVYQFSRMYWKSVSQQPLPVTIKYPELLSKMTPHFSNQVIPPFGRHIPFFL
ncbi:MAG: hypothetical protein K9H84_07210 [Bacteroidales bacterium]|nr:hypothetical protein [Bacteroidales bacterium]